MSRATTGVLWALGAAVGLLALACGPSTPQPPAVATYAPQPSVEATPFVGAPLGASPSPAAAPGASPGAGTPGTTPPAATSAPTSTLVPTPTLLSVGPATPGPLLISAAEQPTGVQVQLRAMQQFQHRLRSLSLGQPTKEDMVQVVQQTASLMAQLPDQIPQMSPMERQQALLSEQELVDGNFRVLSSFVSHSNLTGPTTARGTPEVVPGTPLTVIGTPRPAGMVTPPPSTNQMLAHDIEQLSLEAADLAKGHPDESDMSTWLTSMAFRLSIIRQSVPLLSVQDMQQMTTAIAQAMNQFADTMNTFVNQ